MAKWKTNTGPPQLADPQRDVDLLVKESRRAVVDRRRGQDVGRVARDLTAGEFRVVVQARLFQVRQVGRVVDVREHVQVAELHGQTGTTRGSPRPSHPPIFLRKTRASPTRTVNLSLSRNSRIGIANLRERPVICLNALGVERLVFGEVRGELFLQRGQDARFEKERLAQRNQPAGCGQPLQDAGPRRPRRGRNALSASRTVGGVSPASANAATISVSAADSASARTTR